jgi:hypothetical protein
VKAVNMALDIPKPKNFSRPPPRRPSDADMLRILQAISDGRAVRANEHGPALSRVDFGAAAGMALRDNPLTKAIRRNGQESPRLELTEAGRAALAALSS